MNGPRGARINLTPAQTLVLGFLAAIAVGTALLVLPVASADGESMGLVNALFEATSAVCVTGLVVVDTGSELSLFGQLVILALIQIGGLGIMTMSTLVALILGKRIGLKERILIQRSMGYVNLAGLVRLTRYVLVIAAVIQGMGALLLTLRWAWQYPLGRAAYLGIFHSISAFNNAGFDLFGVSLEGYVTDPYVNIVMGALIVIGGVGFTVIVDVLSARGTRKKLSLHTRIVLRTTALLLLVGFLGFLILEFSNPATLGPLPLGGKVLAAAFQSITPRTAGFNTVPIDQVGGATALFLMLLMFIGGSPGATAGGIKTTTLVAVLTSVWATVSGRGEVVIFERRLSRETIDRALAIFFIALSVVMLTAVLLLVTETGPFLDVVFEAMSAFGTVGLSRGITPELSTAGRLIVTVTMFIGRVGPLTLAVALAQRQTTRAEVSYPEEKIMIG